MSYVSRDTWLKYLPLLGKSSPSLSTSWVGNVRDESSDL